MPHTKYLRQIDSMRRELVAWQDRYDINARTTTNHYLAERFSDRGEAIGRAIHGLDQVADVIRELPRTSL